MSSILDALKKLENDSVDNEPGGPGGPTGGVEVERSRPAAGGSPKGRRSLVYFALGFLAAACLILLFFQRPAPDLPGKSAPETEAPVSRVEIPPPADPVEQHATSPSMDSSYPAASAARSAPPVRPSPPAASEKRPVSVPPPKPPKAPDQESRPAPRKAPPPKPGAAPAPEPRPAPLAPVSELKLQAIAWSEDPDRRMAVINGRIIHEGDSLGGRTVGGIGKDTVVLRAGEKTWTLVFKRDQVVEGE